MKGDRLGTVLEALRIMEGRGGKKGREEREEARKQEAWGREVMRGTTNWEGHLANRAKAGQKVRKTKRQLRIMTAMNHGLKGLKHRAGIPCGEDVCIGEWDKCPWKKLGYECVIGARLMEAYIREQAEERYWAKGLTGADWADLRDESRLDLLAYVRADGKGGGWSPKQQAAALRLKAEIRKARLARWAEEEGHGGLEMPDIARGEKIADEA